MGDNSELQSVSEIKVGVAGNLRNRGRTKKAFAYFSFILFPPAQLILAGINPLYHIYKYILKNS